jgi:hypothetical protein
VTVTALTVSVGAVVTAAGVVTVAGVVVAGVASGVLPQEANIIPATTITKSANFFIGFLVLIVWFNQAQIYR